MAGNKTIKWFSTMANICYGSDVIDRIRFAFFQQGYYEGFFPDFRVGFRSYEVIVEVAEEGGDMRNDRRKIFEFNRIWAISFGFEKSSFEERNSFVKGEFSKIESR